MSNETEILNRDVPGHGGPNDRAQVDPVRRSRTLLFDGLAWSTATLTATHRCRES